MNARTGFRFRRRRGDAVVGIQKWIRQRVLTRDGPVKSPEVFNTVFFLNRDGRGRQCGNVQVISFHDRLTMPGPRGRRATSLHAPTGKRTDKGYRGCPACEGRWCRTDRACPAARTRLECGTLQPRWSETGTAVQHREAGFHFRMGATTYLSQERTHDHPPPEPHADTSPPSVTRHRFRHHGPTHGRPKLRSLHRR